MTMDKIHRQVWLLDISICAVFVVHAGMHGFDRRRTLHRLRPCSTCLRPHRYVPKDDSELLG